MVGPALTKESERETARLAALGYLDAVRPEADQVLQELVDEVRSIFGTELGMVNLILSDTQYFRAWSGGLPANLVEVRQDLRENSMCPHVVANEMPLSVRDFLATEEFKDQHYCVEYGFRSYAGTPLITSEGHAIGTLCLLDTRPRELGEEQMKVLAAFARAVVGRLELLGALTREQRAKKEEAQRSQELQRTQARLKTILDNLTEGVLVINLQGHVLFANPAARAMVGTKSGEFPQELPNPWEDFHLPEAVTHCATSRESIEAQVRYGDTFLRVKLECLVESNNQGDVLVVIQDLSEGRRLEANQQRFLANAAHQLRTPTMAIMGAAELLATGEDANPATRERLLNHIFSDGRRMQRLSDALLRLSRVGWDSREPSLGVVDLRTACQQAAELMEPLVESAGLRLSIESEAACVRADPEWLQEVLLVLLSNAIKHSSRGGDIRLRARASTVIVEDEGAGVSSADLPHIFERFYRGKGHSEGFGLGLSICRELTERMGGSISARSREGVGTAVEIKLPEVDVDECGVRHKD